MTTAKGILKVVSVLFIIKGVNAGIDLTERVCGRKSGPVKERGVVHVFLHRSIESSRTLHKI